MLGAAAMLILAVLMGCETSTAWNVGVGADLNDDGEVGSNPVGFVELVAPVSDRVAITYMHISSLGGSDHNPIDMVSVRYTIKRHGDE